MLCILVGIYCGLGHTLATLLHNLLLHTPPTVISAEITVLEGKVFRLALQEEFLASINRNQIEGELSIKLMRRVVLRAFAFRVRPGAVATKNSLPGASMMFILYIFTLLLLAQRGMEGHALTLRISPGL